MFDQLRAKEKVSKKKKKVLAYVLWIIVLLFHHSNRDRCFVHPDTRFVYALLQLVISPCVNSRL